MIITSDNKKADEQEIRDWLVLLFLIDVSLMFIGLFVANAAAWWIWLTYHLASLTYTAFVLRLAFRASRHIPKSIPFQRSLGILLYGSCHAIRICAPGQIPISLVGYLMFAGPISLLLLFDHLNKQPNKNDLLNDI